MIKQTKQIRQPSRGMTLLEVLIALAIFATAAISVIRAVTQHINTLTYLEEKTFASMVVDNQLALLHLGKPLSSTKKGKEEFAGKTWYWTAKPVKTGMDLIKAVDVSVSTDSQRKNSILTVRTYVKP
ncbi:type II secretion system minor pseudopilin GspI [Vibrio sp. S11_S32]|uniref:type II secretion system minor pseudopilin GspI n=1 Tax=Vibrio sp. S11_S32 TaxID=2720225 RepID=UPI0016801B02|nr:type II secretion system minor pseudopilin GspI [Vibrio sp. S11_S32]MBD1576010.1 type II secretion system minor pseudopilin GspI [Vibrio sp. S11_S32]